MESNLNESIKKEALFCIVFQDHQFTILKLA